MPLPFQSDPYGFSEKRVRELREQFATFDRNKDGTISVHEIGRVMQALGQNPTNREIQEMMRRADKDGSGTIDFTEFVRLVEGTGLKDANTQERELKEAFRKFDRDGNGYISANELRYAMLNMGEKLSTSEANELLAMADIDRDGRINYREFSRLMTDPMRRHVR